MGIVSQALRNSAKGQGCTMQLPYICNYDPATTVLAHLPSPVKGMGNKGDDFFAVFACSACHAHMDAHPLEIADAKLEALRRTQRFWIDNGLLTLKNDNVLHIKRAKGASKSLPPRKLFD